MKDKKPSVKQSWSQDHLDYYSDSDVSEQDSYDSDDNDLYYEPPRDNSLATNFRNLFKNQNFHPTNFRNLLIFFKNQNLDPTNFEEKLYKYTLIMKICIDHGLNDHNLQNRIIDHFDSHSLANRIKIMRAIRFGLKIGFSPLPVEVKIYDKLMFEAREEYQNIKCHQDLNPHSPYSHMNLDHSPSVQNPY